MQWNPAERNGGPLRNGERYMRAHNVLDRIIVLVLGVGAAVATWPVSPGELPTGVEVGTRILVFDMYDQHLGCVNDRFDLHVEVAYTFKVTTTPQGEAAFHDVLRESITGKLTSKSTGAVWTRVGAVSPSVDRSTGGGMLKWAYMGSFVRDSEPTIRTREVAHTSYDGNGILRAEWYQFDCLASEVLSS